MKGVKGGTLRPNYQATKALSIARSVQDARFKNAVDSFSLSSFIALTSLSLWLDLLSG